MEGNYIGNNPNGLDLVLSDDASTNRSDLIASTKCVFNAIQENASDINVSDDYTTNSSDLVASTKCVYNAIQDSIGSGGILPGTIVAFSGQFGGEGNRYPIPLTGTEPDTHWCLCDGIETNNLTVPDLRGKMILGSSTEHTVGETGGSETHTHSVSGDVASSGSHSHSLLGRVSAMTLSVSQMPKHSHVYAKFHYPGSTWSQGASQFLQTTGDTSIAGGSSSHSHNDSFSIGSGGLHTHSLSGVSATRSNNLPPYYTLSYIIRIA